MLTAEHKVLGQRHDAASVWVENAGALEKRMLFFLLRTD